MGAKSSQNPAGTGEGNGSHDSMSPASQDSQTAAEFIDSQLQLEADAREALPYKFDTCTRPLGSLRQLLFACLTCNPPLAPYHPPTAHTPAAVCYSCSVSCHGEHTLVELFNKRNFVCDCGTTRMPDTSPCSLRLNASTNTKGGVVAEVAEEKNQYNHNFANHFCACACDYDPHQQKGTMYQCLGLGSTNDGGCGEDWYHPSCILGLDPDWYEQQQAQTAGFLTSIVDVAPAVVEERKKDEGHSTGGLLDTIGEVAHAVVIGENDDGEERGEESDRVPPGFPAEDDFEGFICYKCVDANPWIKKYADSTGFLPPVFHRSAAPSPEIRTGASPEFKKRKGEESKSEESKSEESKSEESKSEEPKGEDFRSKESNSEESKKRKGEEPNEQYTSKRFKDGNGQTIVPQTECRARTLPSPPPESISLFFKADFRYHFCRCSDCFPTLAKHPQLLEEEDAYEPPVSSDGESTIGTGSLYERGESVLKNVDRVRAIEGVMAYNQLKDKLTPFFKQFAESGKAISAEDIKAHFAKMRGDDEGAIAEAGVP